jgi:hypothetical protein
MTSANYAKNTYECMIMVTNSFVFTASTTRDNYSKGSDVTNPKDDLAGPHAKILNRCERNMRILCGARHCCGHVQRL